MVFSDFLGWCLVILYDFGPWICIVALIQF